MNKDIKNPNNTLNISKEKKSNIITKIRTTWQLHKQSVTVNYISNSILIKIVSDIKGWHTPVVWGAIYKKGEYSLEHTHKFSDGVLEGWSWVYYIDCCKYCAPLKIINTEFIPQPEQIVYFRNDTPHQVAMQLCDHDRIILAGNIKQNI